VSNDRVSHLLWTRPAWLLRDEAFWPSRDVPDGKLPEHRAVRSLNVVCQAVTEPETILRSSPLHRLLRATAGCHRRRQNVPLASFLGRTIRRSRHLRTRENAEISDFRHPALLFTRTHCIYCIISHLYYIPLYHISGNRTTCNYVQLHSHTHSLSCAIRDPRAALSVRFSIHFLAPEFRAHTHSTLHSISLFLMFTNSLCTFSHCSPLYITHFINALLILATNANELSNTCLRTTSLSHSIH